MLSGLIAVLGLSAVLVDDTLPRTLGEPLAAVDLEAEPQSRPQGRRGAPSRPFFDFEHAELGAWVGVAQFSGEFEADPAFAAGVLFRVPLGKLGRAGLWAEALATSIDRDLNPL